MNPISPRRHGASFTSLAILALLFHMPAAWAQTDATQSYGGELIFSAPPSSTAASGTLRPSGTRLNGSITLAATDPRLAGTYAVRGRHKGQKFVLRGLNEAHTRLYWIGSVTADGFTGAVVLRARKEPPMPYVRLDGTLTLGGGSASGAGADVFAQNCAVCHGADATGLSGRPDIHCNRSIHDTVRNGRIGSIGVMPAFANLSDADIAAVQAFLNDLCPAANGADLFASNCAACHGAGAEGGATAPNIQCAVPSRIFNAVRSGRGNGLMPVFPVASVSDAQVTMIATHLETLCSGQPAARFASSCATCHGDTAGGGRNADGVRGPNIRCTEAHDFLEKIRFGDERMPSFPEIGTAEIGGLASYVHQAFCALGDGGDL